jgi:tetratricopeptide (TPR) repeat protein
MLQGIPVSAVRDEMVRAAQRALQLDPTLAQPHVTLGMAHGFALEWDSAAAEFRTAIGLDARHVESRNQYARHLRNRGRLPEALQQLRAARALDPISAVVVSQMSYVYYLLGQIDSALVESRRALQNDPLGRTSLALGALVRLANNDPAEARRLIDQAPSTSPIIGYVIAKSGDLNTARQRLAALDAQLPQPWMAETNRAYTYLGLGDTARALSALERATDAGEIWPAVESFRDPMYDPIRRSSRFQALLRRVGLPD